MFWPNVIRQTACAVVLLSVPLALSAAPISGTYMEARTCQVYTGPCFANGEVGLAGKDAVMAWSISSGKIGDVDLSGLNVAVIVRASDTLGHKGLNDAHTLESMIIVDSKGSTAQRDALVQFAKRQTGKAGKAIKTIQTADINMRLDKIALTGQLSAGDFVQLKTRKARPGDCICSNESAYYPPLAKLDGCVPGVTIDGRVKARSLGTRWSIPDSRTAYLGTFEVE